MKILLLELELEMQKPGIWKAVGLMSMLLPKHYQKKKGQVGAIGTIQHK